MNLARSKALVKQGLVWGPKFLHTYELYKRRPLSHKVAAVLRMASGVLEFEKVQKIQVLSDARLSETISTIATHLHFECLDHNYSF